MVQLSPSARSPGPPPGARDVGDDSRHRRPETVRQRARAAATGMPMIASTRTWHVQYYVPQKHGHGEPLHHTWAMHVYTRARHVYCMTRHVRLHLSVGSVEWDPRSRRTAQRPVSRMPVPARRTAFF